ncbi:MAG TPA: YCF48-related protein [Chloroflexota bacterium]|nr:YCF48-related protein [Chloroflexota bacterium]
MIRGLLTIACALLVLAPVQGAGYAPSAAGQPADARSSSPYPPDLSDVVCPSTRVCYTVGYYGVQYNGSIFATTDGGRTWHPQKPGTKWGLRGITCISTTTCYSVGFAETTMVTTNAGRSWRDPHTPLSPQPLFRIACPTSVICIATGNSPGGYIALVHRLLLTTNGAHTWSYPATPIDRTAYPMNGIACPSARVCYVVGGYATILVTSDAGRTWKQQHNPAMDSSGLIPPLTSVACASPRACVAVGGFPDGGVILTTGDGGRTWTSQAGPARSALTGVACPTARMCYVTGSGGTIEQTADGGHTWTLVDSGTSTSLNSIACHGPSFCVVVGDAGFIAILTGPVQGGKTTPPTPIPGRPTTQPQPTLPPAPTPTTTPAPAPTLASVPCPSWNVAGMWQFQSMTMGAGRATLRQSGAILSGSVITGGVTWTLQGSIQGPNVTLSMSAPGQVAQDFQGTVSSDGATINGNVGAFSGGAASCLP